ncbi:hypothetical protein GCM10027443_43280 [Pontibacter brevis]
MGHWHLHVSVLHAHMLHVLLMPHLMRCILGLLLVALVLCCGWQSQSGDDQAV